MTDFFLQMGLSNACFSLALAIVAMVVGAKARRPHLAHMLWLLVFIKLVTPPIVTIPIVTIPAQGETAVAINENSRLGPPLSNSRQLNTEAFMSSKLGFAAWNHARVWLPPIWLLGSVVVFAWSMVRVCRFSRLLAAKSEAAPQELQTAAVKIARRLRLNTIPTICTTSARISPMVWWTGGKVRIVIPTTLLDKMDAHEWQWVLAHELAHVRRRDYLVRWLEWLACVCFWWNPVVWWAQRNLRAMEEICCDELVISCLNPKPKFYANSLLSAVEFLARPVFRPPAMASEINSGGFLERRFKMIVSANPKRSNTRWLQACVLLCAMVVLPLGIASAQDYEAVERRLGEAVSSGELSLEQAVVMMDALKKAGGTRKDQGADRAEAYLMKVKKELGELVEAGSISREDAAKRYEGAVKAIKERMAAGRRERQRGARGERERGERRFTREDYARAEEKMRKMVEEGKAKPEDVERRLIEMRRMIAAQGERGARGESERDQRSITIEEYRRAEAKMRKMIEDGKAKPEDVERRLIEMRKMIGGQSKRGGERQRTTRGDKRAEYEGFERRIKAAVREGKMTREEAREKLEDYKKRISR
jgi:beta-lactamase regulating signal transducer with metallopeptidase domain